MIPLSSCTAKTRTMHRTIDIPRIVSPSSSRALFSSWNVDSNTGIVSSKEKGSPHFQTVIGLEIHAQLNIPTKLFSSCPRPTSTFAKPNSHIRPFDVSVPGFLPRLSREAVHAAVLSASALNCEIPRISRFERKHYFYADLPLGYQITQQRWPLAREGFLLCQNKSRKKGERHMLDSTFSPRIERIQLEQDTGKTIMMTRKDGTIDSLVDFNRAGCALIEIVFHPDLRSSIQAATTVETLRNLLRHIGTCDGKMEEGSLRCDLNVSIAPVHGDGDILERTGKRVEVKNLNSLRQIQLAAEYEAIRQVKALLDDKPTDQETRTFEVKSGKTIVMRTKEGAKDYRFMPEPDLPPIILDREAFNGLEISQFLKVALPELPDAARARLQSSYGLSAYIANVLTSDPPAIQMLDEAVTEAANQTKGGIKTKVLAEHVANLLANELFALVREHELSKALEEEDVTEASVKFSAVSAEQLGALSLMLAEGEISSTMAKHILRILYTEEQGRDPRELAKERGFKLISNKEALEQICHAVIEENPTEMEKYRMGGKFARKITKFFLGKAMQEANGNAHPERLNEVMLDILDEVAPGIER